MNDPLNSSQVETLEVSIEEATRSTEEGVKYFIEPAQGALSRALAKRPHIVFGRRGSGKSSLLRKIVADLTVYRRTIAFVDLESFKGHSYPDVLISILIQTLERFSFWLTTAAVNPANKTSFWQKVFGTAPKRPPFDKAQTKALSLRLETEIADLRKVLLTEDVVAAETSNVRAESTEKAAEAGAKIAAGPAEVGGKSSEGSKKSSEDKVTERFTRNKLDLLHRRIIEYQKIFRDLSALSNGDSYLVLDDLYHIRKSDQPRVIDHFHRLGKSANLWVKVGTIRHRSSWYLNGDPPIAMKIGDDGDEIDLDLTLEKYEQAKAFLSRILKNFFDTVNLKIDDILTDGALDRLVLASAEHFALFLSSSSLANHAAHRLSSEQSCRLRLPAAALGRSCACLFKWTISARFARCKRAFNVPSGSPSMLAASCKE